MVQPDEDHLNDIMLRVIWKLLPSDAKNKPLTQVLNQVFECSIPHSALQCLNFATCAPELMVDRYKDII